MSSTRSASFLGVGSPPPVSAADHEGKDNKSTPRYLWTLRKKAIHPTTGNNTTQWLQEW
jgi:hypothetical protein